MSDYQTCMTGAMKKFPKGISREERGRLFCINAKLCSGKATTESEAAQICASQPPKVKKMKVKKGASCEKDAGKLAQCVVNFLTENETYRDHALNINSVGSAVNLAILECSCPNQG